MDGAEYITFNNKDDYYIRDLFLECGYIEKSTDNKYKVTPDGQAAAAEVHEANRIKNGWKTE